MVDFLGWKNRENVVRLDFLAVDNFDFTRKIVKKKNWAKNSWKCLGDYQNWIFGQKFDFLNSVRSIISGENPIRFPRFSCSLFDQMMFSQLRLLFRIQIPNFLFTFRISEFCLDIFVNLSICGGAFYGTLKPGEILCKLCISIDYGAWECAEGVVLHFYSWWFSDEK